MFASFHLYALALSQPATTCLDCYTCTCTRESCARNIERRCTMAASCEPSQLEATLIVGIDESVTDFEDEATELAV